MNNALQEYFINNALNNALLRSKAGDRTGADFLDFVSKLTKFSALIHGLSRFIPAEIAENLTMAGVFDKDWMGDADKTKALLTKIEKLFNDECDDEVTWTATVTSEENIEMIKETRGVKTSYFAKKENFDLPEALAIVGVKNDILADFETPVTLIRNDDEYTATKPTQLFETILEIGKKGVTTQRFKGLGEMNAEQLWETTLDPANRTLLQVKVDQAEEADETFSTLMGNVVEPRRDFIQENALKVVNLDV
jgi:DNA gyrase subunit B